MKHLTLLNYFKRTQNFAGNLFIGDEILLRRSWYDLNVSALRKEDEVLKPGNSFQYYARLFIILNGSRPALVFWNGCA